MRACDPGLEFRSHILQEAGEQVQLEHKIIGSGVGPIIVETSAYNRPVPVAEVVENLSTGFLPPFVRWIDGSKTLWLIELPPRYITVSYGRGFGTRSATIPIPWQVYFFDLTRITNFKVWFRPEKMSSLDDVVYHSFLSNVYASDIPCHGWEYIPGRGALDTRLTNGEPLDRIMHAIQLFWLANFSGGHYIAGLGDDSSPGLPLELQEAIDKGRESSGPNWWLDSLYPILADMDLNKILRLHYVPAGKAKFHIRKAIASVSYWNLLTTAGLK